jgi:hypothetical protein
MSFGTKVFIFVLLLWTAFGVFVFIRHVAKSHICESARGFYVNTYNKGYVCLKHIEGVKLE